MAVNNLSLSKRGLEHLKREEGCRLNAYQDSVGVWTIGYGHTGFIDGYKVKKGLHISQEKAEAVLRDDCRRFTHFQIPRFCVLSPPLN